jgi:hypothetical protein
MIHDENGRSRRSSSSIVHSTPASASASEHSRYRFSAQSSDICNDAKACFSQHGFVVIEQCLTEQQDDYLHKEILDQWRQFVPTWFNFCLETLYRNGHTTMLRHYNPDTGEYALGLGAKHGFSEIVMRSPGRYELSLNGYYGIGHHHGKEQTMANNDDVISTTSIVEPLPAHCWKAIVESTVLSSLLPSLLGKNNQSSSMDHLKLCHVSLLVATPGSTEQGWHIDGGHVNLSHHLPCHALNIFLPLDPVPLERGPTEFRPGTHYHSRNLGPMMLAAKCRKSLLPPYCATVQPGDVLLFDYRVLHRGRANVSCENRNFLVLTYAQEWFEDIVNFPQRSMMEKSNTQTTRPYSEEQQPISTEKEPEET